MAKKQEIDWIDEKRAAAMLGYTNLNWFRRLVKKGQLPIHYSSVQNRRHIYVKQDIENYIYENSNLAV